MSKIYHIFFLLIFLYLKSNSLYSQSKSIDSLKVALKSTKSDIDKANLYNAIANQYKFISNPDLMIVYANKALQLSQKLNLKKEEAHAKLILGNANTFLGNYAKSLKYLSEAQTFFENEVEQYPDEELKKGLAKVYGSISIVYNEKSQYNTALNYNFKSLKIYEELKDEVMCAKLYNNIGVVYKSQNSDEKALPYFLKAKTIQQKFNDNNIAVTYTNIGNCYLKQNKFSEAFSFYQQAKKEIDKTNNPRWLGELYNNLGLYYKAIKQLNKAEKNWRMAISTFEKNDDIFGMVDSHRELGKLYFEQNKLQEAIVNVNKAIDLSKKIDVLEQRVLGEKILSDIYKKQNNTQLAFEHFQLYSQAKDSLINKENIIKTVEEEMKFEFEKKEILLKEEAQRHKLQIIFFGLIGLLLFGIAFLIYKKNQQQKTLKLQKELAEYEQKALHLQMNPHFVFNCLSSISSFIVNNGKESAILYLAKFAKLMRLTLDYSKENLIPIDKEIESLQNYLELEQLRFNNKFNFSITKQTEIDDDIGLPSLLLQPFVENAIIHGVSLKEGVGQIDVVFELHNNSLLCSVIDNGIGYKQSLINKEKFLDVHKSMAMEITQRRLQMIEETTKQKAVFAINEIADEYGVAQGTEVVITLPLQYIK